MNKMRISKIKVGCTSTMKIFVINKGLTTQFDATTKAIRLILAQKQYGLVVVNHNGKLTVCTGSEADELQDVTLKATDNIGGWREATEEEIKQFKIEFEKIG
jgi:hypothetical protein